MAHEHELQIHGLHPKAPLRRLLGPGEWTQLDSVHQGRLTSEVAADLRVRLHGLVLLGSKIEVKISPPLARRELRAALTRKAHALRQGTPGFLKKNTRLDEQGRYSLTPESLAMEMAKKNSCAKVLDLGCGAGGNAIAFARCGARVTAYELDPKRAEMARHNCEVYGVRDRVQVRSEDALLALPSRFEGLVFCDPPWGRDFKQHASELSRYPLAQALWEARDRFEQLWLKLPPAFDPSSLTNLHASKVRIQVYFGKAKGDANTPKFIVVRSWSSTL